MAGLSLSAMSDILLTMRHGPLRRAAALAAARRGVTALIFAVSATAVLGFVGLGTEVGTWYLARAQASNVADAAAIAGALAAYSGADAGGVEAAANDAVVLASLNGYSYNPLSVTANYNPPSATYAANATATQVEISVPFASVLASLFSNQPVTVAATAVGLVGPTNYPACALSLTGPLIITQAQNGSNFAGPCYYASNYAGTGAGSTSEAVIVSNGATIAAYGITTAGDCASTCPNVPPLTGGGQYSLLRPYASYQPPTTNPFAAIDTLSLPASSAGITCIVPAGQSAGCRPSATAVSIQAGSSLVPSTGDNGVTCTPTTGPCAYYNMNITIGSGATLTPGTYFFVKSSLTIQGGTVKCIISARQLSPCDNADGSPSNPGASPGTAGVTLVFTGSPAGGLTICGKAVTASCPLGTGATVLLSAPAANSVSPSLDGILFYRAGPTLPNPPSDSSSAPAVSIADSIGNTLLNGGMYFPNAYTWYAANIGTDPDCSILLAGYLNLGYLNAGDVPSRPPNAQYPGPATTQFGAACAAYATPLPSVQAVQVVQ